MIRGFDTAESGHANVEQYNVRAYIGRDVDGLFTVAGLTSKLVAVEVFNDLSQPISGETFIIDDEYLHSIISSAGKRSSIE